MEGTYLAQVAQLISCSFLYFIYRELKEIRLQYVPHTLCRERRKSCGANSRAVIEEERRRF